MFSICLFLICSDMFLDSMSNAFNRFSAIDFYPYLIIKNAKEIFVALMPFFRIPNYFRIPALLWRFEKYNNYNLNFT